MKQYFFPVWIFTQPIFYSLAFLCAFDAVAANTWSYHQENDRLNNRSYSFAESPMPSHDLYDDIRLEVLCKDNVLQVILNADSLIASQDSLFDFEYQIDKKKPVTLSMRTFKDSKRRAYTQDQARHIVDELLSGQTVFIRVNTLIRKVLSAGLPLENASEPLQKVLADCGLSLAKNPPAETAYSLSDFEKELNNLSSEQQLQVLKKIKQIIMETQKALPSDK